MNTSPKDDAENTVNNAMLTDRALNIKNYLTEKIIAQLFSNYILYVTIIG
jgi:hypothetical protein